MKNIHKLFNGSGQISTYEAEQRRRTLHVILWVIFIAGLILGITNFIYGFFLAGLTVLVLCAASLVAMRLNQKGYFIAAAVIVSGLLLFVVVFDIVDAGGLGNDLGMAAFPVVVTVCSLFLGKRGLLIFSTLCILSVCVIGYLDIQQVIYAPPIKTDWGDLIPVLVLLAGTAILLWVILDNAEKNLKKIKDEDSDVWISYDLTLEGLAKTLELRDQDTEYHSRRVVYFSVKLAEALGLEGADLLNINRGALLHDIGKLGVPDTILLKDGPLTEDEWVEMHRHPVHARDILANIPFLQPSIGVPYAHHERWDGGGYPCGLKGEEIPYYARIFSVVDQWEALTADRIYRKAWPREKALTYIRENSGKIYDPEIAAVFLNEIENFEAEQSFDLAPKNDTSMPPEVKPIKKKSEKIDLRDKIGGFQKLWVGPDYVSLYDVEQRKKSLSVILWVAFMASLGLGWTNLPMGGGFLDVSIMLILSGACLFAVYLNIRGHSITGASVVSFLMLIAAGFDVYTWGGLKSMGVVAYPVIVMMSGLFFGKRGLITFTILSGFSVLVIGFLQIYQIFKPTLSDTDLGDVQTLVIFILGVAILLWVILDNAEKNLLGIKKKEAELKASYDFTLEGFAKAFEFRGRDPRGHSQRVVELSLRLAEKMGIQGHEFEIVRRGALLHDIGILSIPDRIVLKSGPLNEEEKAEMQQHPERARELLAKIPYLQSCISIPYCHHENWDGTGYPRGLKGEEIPLHARLFTLVDHWEELTSDRPFRLAWLREKVLDHIQENSGRLYDPQIANVFLNLIESRG